MIINSMSRIAMTTSAMVRVMSQCRGNGRARIRSANPVSISDAGMVASAMVTASKAMMKPVSKYTPHTIPLKVMTLASDGPMIPRMAGGRSAVI